MIFAEKLSSRFFTIPTKLKLVTLLLTIFPFITACSSTSTSASIQPSSKDINLISHPSKEILSKIDALMPAAMKWYDDVHKAFYHKGRVLTEVEKKQAKQLGVRNPNAVRVVVLDKFPEPNDDIANASHVEGARAMGNIIMIKPHLKNDSVILCHELVHVAQKDRMGLRSFLKQITLENHILGYSKSLLESEAYALQQTIM